MKYSVLVFGYSGLVGRTVLEILQNREFPVSSIYLVASNKSVGKKINFNKNEITIISVEDSLKLSSLNYVFFCSSSSLSKKYTNKYLETYPNVYFIDNSSYWRMNPKVPIIIPPINSSLLQSNNRIFANSNCTTSGLVLFLNPIKDCIKEIDIVSMQSCSGSGYKGNYHLEDERNLVKNKRIYYECSIDQNLIPKIGEYTHNNINNRDNVDTDEEMKLLQETNKILGTNIDITATCIRCPIYRCHSLAVTIRTKTEVELSWIEKQLEKQDGLIYSNTQYFTPKDTISSYDVYVSRLRCSGKKISAFITFDNLYRGASWNSVDIAENLNKLMSR